jgi:hypothetical protein
MKRGSLLQRIREPSRRTTEAMLTDGSGFSSGCGGESRVEVSGTLIFSPLMHAPGTSSSPHHLWSHLFCPQLPQLPQLPQTRPTLSFPPNRPQHETWRRPLTTPRISSQVHDTFSAARANVPLRVLTISHVTSARVRLFSSLHGMIA